MECQRGEAFFLGSLPKDKELQAFGARMFFDDQETRPAPSSVVPARKVPCEGEFLHAAKKQTSTDQLDTNTG